MKEKILEVLKENPNLLKELLQEAPELKTIIKQALKQPREKSLLAKLKKWGIEETAIPQEYLNNLSVIEGFLNWLDNEIQTRTAGQKGLNLSLRPLKKENQNPNQE